MPNARARSKPPARRRDPLLHWEHTPRGNPRVRRLLRISQVRQVCQVDDPTREIWVATVGVDCIVRLEDAGPTRIERGSTLLFSEVQILGPLDSKRIGQGGDYRFRSSRKRA